MTIGAAQQFFLGASKATGGGGAGYQIERSLRFNSSDSASLSRASYAGSGTFSCWVKRCKLGTAQTIISGVAFNASDQLNSSTAVFRDPSALMHVLVSTSGTYVNGTSVASGSAITPGIIGSGCDLYLADIYFIDGQALTPSSFTEVSATTGQLVPKAYTGSFGTNGFWLKFSDNSAATATTLGKDYSGNSNNWTPNNLSVTAGAGNDSLVDTPTSYGTDTGAGGEVRGNYCTWNPLDKGSSVTLANGNLDFSQTATLGSCRGTIGVSSGKWYWEVSSPSSGSAVGIMKASANISDYVGGDANGWSYYANNGFKYNSNSGASYGATFGSGDVIGVAFDADVGTLTFYKNGASQGQAYSGLTSGLYFPAFGNGSTSCSVNFGQRPFAYTAPSGYKALCDTNLPAPVVAKPSTVMDVVLRTGTGTSGGTISSLNFSADFIWSKLRSTSSSHYLLDSVRGIANTLQSNSTGSEASYPTWFTSITSTGYTVGSGDWTSGASVVEWCWDAGTSTVSNTQGSITSSVRANASAGFSIVTYTGNLSSSGTATVGHGLNVAPQMIITKRRNGASDWVVQHAGLPSANNLIFLNSTSSTITSAYGTIVAPTSSVFTTSWTTGLNTNGDTHVGYCFAPVTGYSSSFSYTGNGSTDGVFVYLGFRAKLLLIKRTDTTGNWYLWDTVRNTYNVVGEELYPNLSNAAATATDLDILSNGFKMRSTAADFNASGGTYVGFAISETAFQYSRAR